MNRERYLLDTSALLTLIEGEAGADRVREALGDESTIIPWVALLEVLYISEKERDATEAENRYAMLKQLPVTFLWQIDEPALLTAARLKARNRISFADALIAAFAIRSGATLMHKDPEYEALKGQVKLSPLPYKGGGD